MKEKDIQKLILDYLRITRYCFWRNNTGGMTGNYKGKQWFMRFGDIGSPDIFVVKNSKIIGIEVKGDKGLQSEHQKEWQQKFEANGGIYILAYSLEDVLKIL